MAATLTGILAIILFGLWGAVLMSNWAIVAASRIPLSATIDAMGRENQPYSVLPGVLFGAAGATLALAWGRLMWAAHLKVPAWAGLALWSAIIALGGPAYFFASFSNLNAVGDTFYDWDAEAAFAREAPLYLMSATAAVLMVSTIVVALIRGKSRTSAHTSRQQRNARQAR